MVVFGLLCAVALADGQKISVELEAMPAAKAVQQVGAAAHLTLTTSPQTADDILLLRFKDVSVEEAMRRIAIADDATWKKEGTSFRLIRTSEQRRAEEEEEIRHDAEMLSKAIAKKTAILEHLPAWGPKTADVLASKVSTLLKTFNPQSQDYTWFNSVSQLADQAPFGRAVSRVLTCLDTREIAQLPPRLKTVWSTNPTRAQLPMPPAVAVVVNQFLRDNAEWAAAAEKWHLQAPRIGNQNYWAGDFGDFSSTAATPENVAVVLMSSISFGRNHLSWFELSAYDHKGKRLADSAINLNEFYEEPAPEKPSDTPPGEQKMTLSDEAKTITEAQVQNYTAWKPMSPALVATIADAKRYDPLNIFLAPCLVQAASIKGVNLAAHLSDDMGFSTLISPKNPTSVAQFLSALKSVGGKLELRDGWLMVQPSRPIVGREIQAERTELKKYLQRCTDPRHLSLDERAAFALALPNPQDNGLPQELANLVRLGEVNEYSDRELLKIYGLMTSEQKSRMLGEGLPCGALNGEQRQNLNELVFGMYAYLNYQQTPEMKGQRGALDLYYNGILHEPTESMPDGIPPNALIKLTEKDSTVAVLGEKMVSQYSRPGATLDANGLAFQKFSQDHPEFFPPAEYEDRKLDLNKIRCGRRVQLSFIFQLTPVIFMPQSLEDLDDNAFRPVTFADLPDDFRRPFQDAYGGFAKSYANAKPGQGGSNRNTNIPPSL